MANTGFKGVDVRQSGGNVVVRASLKDASGAPVVAGTIRLRILETQSDGTVKQLDFAGTPAFRSSGLSTAYKAMGYQAMPDGSALVGYWSYALTTQENAAFTANGIYTAIVSDQTGTPTASPPTQEREFQYGGAEGDVTVASGKTAASLAAADVSGNLPADAVKIGGVPQGSTIQNWYVSTTGNDSNDGKTTSTPKLTIMGAVAVAASGDVICIESGTYTEQVNSGTKNLTYQGTYVDDLCTTSETVVQAPVMSRAFIFQFGTLRNLKILGSTAGTAAVSIAGTALTQGYVGDAVAVIEDCSITSPAGAVYTDFTASLTIRRSYISGRCLMDTANHVLIEDSTLEFSGDNPLAGTGSVFDLVRCLVKYTGADISKYAITINSNPLHLFVRDSTLVGYHSVVGLSGNGLFRNTVFIRTATGGVDIEQGAGSSIGIGLSAATTYSGSVTLLAANDITSVYGAAKPSDAMTLTSAYDAAKTAAQQSQLQPAAAAALTAYAAAGGFGVPRIE